MIVPYITLSTWHHRYALATRPNTLPSVIRSPKDFAVCYELFLWHSWWFLPSVVFFNHQHYSRGRGNVQPNVANWAEKNLPAFWWFYTCLGREFLLGLFFVYAAQIFALLTNCAQERDYAVWNGREQEKRRRLASEGSSYHPF